MGRMTPLVCPTAQPFSLNRRQTAFGKLIRPAGRISVFGENSNQGLGMSLDSKGRLFSVQSAYGHTGIAVISPPGTETVITDNFEGMPFGRPNDLIVDKKGGVYFTDPGLNGA